MSLVIDIDGQVYLHLLIHSVKLVSAIVKHGCAIWQVKVHLSFTVPFPVTVWVVGYASTRHIAHSHHVLLVALHSCGFRAVGQC